MTSCLHSCMLIPFQKGVCTKRQEFAPKESRVFPFIVDPIADGNKTLLIELPPLTVCPVPLNTGNENTSDAVC